MGLRLISTLVFLASGLYGFYSTWAHGDVDEPTIWFHQTVPPAVNASSDMLNQIELHRDRSQQELNRTFSSHLLKERERVLQTWTPLSTLTQIALEYNPRLSVYQAEEICSAIIVAGQEYGVDPYLVAALLSQESRFDPGAISPGGAIGLGQIIPTTAASMGINPYVATQNVDGCVRYLSDQIRRWSHTGNAEILALASYNAGPGKVIKYGGVPPYRITQNYVVKISARKERFRERAMEHRDSWIAENTPKLVDLYGQTIES